MAKEYPLLVGRRDRGHKWLRSILFNTFSILKQEKSTTVDFGSAVDFLNMYIEMWANLVHP